MEDSPQDGVAGDTEVQEHYAQGGERDRLAGPLGAVEFARSKEIVRRSLPAPPAAVADIGGGAGRYARWLAEAGYQVEHRDPVPLHVEQLQADVDDRVRVRTAVGDARQVDLDDASMDAVLLLGPLYHLRRRADRLCALGEAARVVRPGGPVFVAAISRWAPRLHGELKQRLYESSPAIREEVPRVERTGRLAPLVPGGFGGYCHRPQQLRAELRRAGLDVVDLVSVEGPAFMLHDLAERMQHPPDRAVVLDAARAVERVPELLGIGPHLLATGIVPGAWARPGS